MRFCAGAWLHCKHASQTPSSHNQIEALWLSFIFIFYDTYVGATQHRFRPIAAGRAANEQAVDLVVVTQGRDLTVADENTSVKPHSYLHFSFRTDYSCVIIALFTTIIRYTFKIIFQNINFSEETCTYLLATFL